jgi:transcriptional regulator with XRE-family HTH domain
LPEIGATMNELWITGTGAVIRRLRGKRPIGAVAKQLGITASTLSLVERNKRRLSIKEIVAFAKIVELSSTHLFAQCLEKPLLSFLIDKLK